MGTTALVVGEAGVGKTSLLHWFDKQARTVCEVYWGACEALHTARPLGPLMDMASALQLSVRESNGKLRPSHELYDALHDRLRDSAAATVLIFEDVHWADQGTLDLIRFLSRRVARLRTLLVLSFRADEVVGDHPLRRVLGDLPADAVLRVPVHPLTQAGITQLAQGSGADPQALFRATAGNPFFATEALAAGDLSVIPHTVRDAVQARMSRLTVSQKSVLNVVSVVPGRAEKWLIRKVLTLSGDVEIDECVFRGLLVETDNTQSVQFRHELARRACEANLSPTQQVALHKRVLAVLIAQPTVSIARCAHHAFAIGDYDNVLRHAQTAAQEAAQAGAHREAAQHLHIGLEAIAAGASASPEVIAQCNETWSYEAALVKITEQTIQAREKAIAIWEQLGNREKVALNYRWASRLHWYRGESALARSYAQRALDTLKDAPPSAEQAWGYSAVSQTAMLNGDNSKAIEFGIRAIELADQVGALEVKVHALNNIGSAELFSGHRAGLEKLTESLAIALREGFHEQAARVYTNVAAYGVSARDLPLALRYASEGLEFDRRHDLDSWTYYLEGVYAQALLYGGRFNEAIATCDSALSHHGLTSVMRLPALTVLTLAYLRVGDPRFKVTFDEAAQAARRTHEIQRIFPIAIAQAEHAWLMDDPGAIIAAVDEVLMMPNHDTNPWDYGELIIWKHRAGCDQSSNVEKSAAPYALEIAGNTEAAAAAWHEIGDPYTQAMVLAHGSVQQRAAAIERFEALGAIPAAQRLRAWAKKCNIDGVRRASRGPYRARKQNDFGISAKESEVLQLLALGKTNQQISDELFRSAKTVEHHVSSLLAKLGAKNRVEAASKAVRYGLIAKSEVES
jgi:DNA-binding CsgD family transcriptional regulator